MFFWDLFRFQNEWNTIPFILLPKERTLKKIILLLASLPLFSCFFFFLYLPCAGFPFVLIRVLDFQTLVDYRDPLASSLT